MVVVVVGGLPWKPPKFVFDHWCCCFRLVLLFGRHLEAAHCFHAASHLALAEPAPALHNTAVACYALGDASAATRIFADALRVSRAEEREPALQGLAFVLRNKRVQDAAAAMAESVLTAGQRRAVEGAAASLQLVHLQDIASLRDPFLLHPAYDAHAYA